MNRYEFDHLVAFLAFQRFLSALLSMHTLWMPGSVAVLFRRVVNVVSSLSISQQYLLPRLQLGEDGANSAEDRLRLWEGFKAIRWPSWNDGNRSLFSSPNASSDVDPEQQETRAVEVDREAPHHLPHRDRPTDTIHQLIHSPVLYDPVRKPRNPIALCHGKPLQAHAKVRLSHSMFKVSMGLMCGAHLPFLSYKCIIGQMS